MSAHVDNYWKNLFFTIVFLLFFSGIPFCFSQPTSSDTSVKDSANICRMTLKNGLRVVIVKNSLAPIVTTEMNYLVGSDETPEGFPGTAHALEHMMFRGSPGLSSSQLSEISALLGGNNNAQTQQMVTQYYFTVPAEDAGVALRIESIRMRGILCTDSLWEKERGAIKQEVAQDLSNPLYLYLNKLYPLMFSGTPYAYDALGSDSSFDKTTATHLKEFYSKWYVPNNAVLVIVGDIDPQKIVPDIRTNFEDIPSRNLPPKPVFKFSDIKNRRLSLPTDLPNGLVVIAYRFPGSNSSQYAAAQVLSDVFNSQRGKLYQLVINGKALSIQFDYEPLPEAGLGFLVAEFPKDSNPDILVRNIDSIINNELTYGIDTDLVQSAKIQEISEAEFMKNSIEGLASVWSDAVAIRGRKSPEEDLRAIQNVTMSDLNNCARTFIDSSHAIISILTPQPSGNQITQHAFGGKETFASKQTMGIKLPSWADSALGKISIPHSTLNPTVMKLQNGITLIVQPESISNTVSVYGRINSNPDIQQPIDKEGIAEIVDELFEFGSKSRDRISLVKSLDSIGAKMSVGATFSIQTLEQHFAKGMDLLADNLLHPRFPEDAFSIVRQKISFIVTGELQSPGYITNRAILHALLPKNDPELREPAPVKINAINLQDVIDYYNKVFRPDMTTIVVIGKISPTVAKEIVWKNFKEWKLTGLKPKIDLPTVPLNKATTIVIPNKSRVQDIVYLSQILTMKRSAPDYYALHLGNQIFGGSSFSAMLFQDLRVNNGLVYYARSQINVSKTRGSFLITYACDPDKVAKVKSMVDQDLKLMKDSLVQDNVLNQAKALLIREIPLSEGSQKSIASGLLKRSLDDLPLDEPVLAAKKYLKINSNDIKKAFTTWIHPENLAQIIEGPQPPQQ
jgi:zinc protease